MTYKHLKCLIRCLLLFVLLYDNGWYSSIVSEPSTDAGNAYIPYSEVQADAGP